MGRIFLAWTGLGAVTGLGLAAALASVNPSVRGAAAASAALLLVAVYTLALGGLGLAVGGLRRLAGRLPAPFAGELLAGAGAVAVTVALDRLVPDLGGGPVGLAAWALPGAAGLATALVLPRRRRGPPLGLALAGLALALALGAGAVAAAALGPRSAAPPPPATLAAREADAPRRVLWVGIDGADWRDVDRLVAAGRLPHLAQLLARGARAPLGTFEPTWSPLIWTTLATGVPPERHGVLDFAETRLPGAPCGVVRVRKAPRLLPDALYLETLTRTAWRAGLLPQVPVTSCQRRRKAVWNVLSERGRRVAVVNWFATWPAERVEGFLVSDNNPWRAAFLESKHRDDRDRGERRITWPPGLLDRLGPFDVPEYPEEPARMLALPFFEEVDAGARRRLLETEPQLLGVFRHILRSDAFAADVAARLLRRERPDFTAVYLSAVDNASHRLGGLPGVVDRVWTRTDARLGRLLEAAGPDATVVITSDHGWEYGEPFGHFHAPDGVLLLAGPGIGARGRLDARPDVYDVAPTLLALFGLPPAAEMPGAPLREALAPAAARLADAPRPASYGAFVPPAPSGGAEASTLQDETLERLRALGYVE